ncbi:hypothetical protein ACYOEI_00210 [Singulisphaera rosea]
MAADETPSYKREHLVPLKQAVKRGLEVTYDAAGYIKTAQVPLPFLIDLLLDKKIINGDHHFYGVQMITMRQLFLKDVSARVGMLRVKSDGEASSENPVAVPMEDNDYLKVLRGMRVIRWKEIVMAVCTVDADPRLYPQLERMEGTVSMAFGNMADSVKALWEQKRAAEKCEVE